MYQDARNHYQNMAHEGATMLPNAIEQNNHDSLDAQGPMQVSGFEVRLQEIRTPNPGTQPTTPNSVKAQVSGGSASCNLLPFL